jgi:hypothetical protein
VIQSSRVRLMQTPAATASCPVDRCSGPRMLACAKLAPNAATPPLEASSAAFSKARMRAMVRNSSSARVDVVKKDALRRGESNKSRNNPSPQSVAWRSGRVGRCYGLQSRLRWFDSNLRLHPFYDRPLADYRRPRSCHRPLPILKHRSEGFARSPSAAPIARRVRHPHRTTPAVS